MANPVFSEPGGWFLLLVGTAMVLWLVVPVVLGLYGLVSDRIKEARAHDEPATQALKEIAGEVISGTIKLVLILALLVIAVWLWGVFFGHHHHGPEYEAWRN